MKTKNPLKIVIAPEDRDEFLGITSFIRNCVSKCQSIPNAIIMRVYDLLYTEETYNENQSWDKAYQISSHVLERISKKMKLQFRWEERKIVESSESYAPDTKQIFAEIAYSFFLYDNEFDGIAKDETIAFVYHCFEENYKNKILSPQALTNRQQAIISGFFAEALKGYPITKQKDPTNENVFQATRNAIKKYKSYNDLFPHHKKKRY